MTRRQGGPFPFYDVETFILDKHPDVETIPGGMLRQERAVAWGARVHAQHVADVLGVERARVVRWRRVGLTVDEADEVAGRLWCHPFEVWGPAWYTISHAASVA